MKSGLLSLSALALALAVSACSSSSEETPDAAPDGGGGSGKAAEIVNCPASVTKQIITNDATPNDNNARFVPAATTVSAGTVVKFVMSDTHDVRSPPLFSIGTGQTACVKFNTVGKYTIFCAPHGFTGTVTVQ